MRFLLIGLVVALTSMNLSAQKGYEINIKVEGIKDTTAFLAYYFGSGQYYRDTAEVNSKGEMKFVGKDTLAHGMYSLVYNNSKVFDILLDNQKFSMSTDTANVIAEMEVKNSVENKIFYEYMKFLNSKQKEARSISKKEAEAVGDDKKMYKDQLSALDTEVRAYISDFHDTYKGSFASNFIYAIEYPTVPEAPKNEDGSIDSTFAFKYFKAHFYDNFDFSDERLLRTSSYDEKMNYYLEKLTVPDVDSIIVSVDYILKNAAQNKTIFKYTLTKLTSKYERSENMGMDAVFVHLGKEYFMKGKAADWFTDKQLEKLSERVTALDPLLIGKKAPNIVVKDTAMQKFIQLYDVKAKYTIVYIWSPECGHCKKATPKLKTLYDKFKDRGVEVFAVGNEFENKEWKEFIIEHELNFINGSDGGDFRSNFRNLYDVFSTPQTYLLDENKVILSKKMSIESLENILDFYFKNEERKKEKTAE